MKIVERFWKTVTYLVSTVSFQHFSLQDSQQPLLTQSVDHVSGNVQADYPVFKPPGRKGFDFVCEYPEMTGWTSCSSADNRGCWLSRDSGKHQFNITTNYENHAPKGITRYYELEMNDGSVAADGLPFDQAKLFNNTYPGPWIQACWGDEIVVKVTNRMAHNGTSVHWHGIRQNLTMEMDGVNGVTQCAIAPGDTFTYKFKAVQYGSSWYHSHYSLQYADGAHGPMTIYGPSSANYDEHIEPLLVTDWAHNSAFKALWVGAANQSIVLNGRGDITQFNHTIANTTAIPAPYSIHFENTTTPRRYHLQLINTGFDSTFVFSIDNHKLQVATADFVPIVPYFNTSVLIGIGQRYQVIVEADPQAGETNPLPHDGNFWIRTYIAENCPRNSTGTKNYEKIGILRYDESSTARPRTEPWNDIALKCSDETYMNLVPVVPWKVGPPSNGDKRKLGEEFNIRVNFSTSLFPKAGFSLGGPGFRPLRIDYGDPSILHLNKAPIWRNRWVVIPADFTEKDWVYLVIRTDAADSGVTEAHPIHLHGHDFAILQQAENKAFMDYNVNLKTNNPPRRDVVLVPNNGFAIIAFKADNPGAWLMHCHIAAHAAFGLGMQIMERQKDANLTWPPLSAVINETERVCKNWNEWQGMCSNWNKDTPCQAGQFGFQDDSGV